MKYLIFFLIVLPFNLKGIDDSYFPQIKGCFCEGGLIYGKAKKKDRIIIDEKIIKEYKDKFLIFALGRNLKKKKKKKINKKKKKRS